ncbi:MAG: hypothetical protein RL362_463 [Bacteroidota bacterium]|jgi:hypothetical protein
MENHFIPLQSLAQQLADQLNGLYSGKNKKDSLEQMVNNSRELYERLIVLRHKAYEQEVQPTPTESIEVEMPVFTLDLEESVNDVPAMEPETSIAFEPEVEAQEEISSIEITPEIEVDTRQVNLMDMIEEVIQEKTTPPAEDNTPIISLNEILAQQQTQHTILKALEKAPIEDLKKSITMNQRFQFARELFKGDSEQYELSISELNNASSEKAMEIFENMKRKWGWDTTSIAFIELEELVQRRHA